MPPTGGGRKWTGDVTHVRIHPAVRGSSCKSVGRSDPTWSAGSQWKTFVLLDELSSPPGQVRPGPTTTAITEEDPRQGPRLHRDQVHAWNRKKGGKTLPYTSVPKWRRASSFSLFPSSHPFKAARPRGGGGGARATTWLSPLRSGLPSDLEVKFPAERFSIAASQPRGGRGKRTVEIDRGPSLPPYS